MRRVAIAVLLMGMAWPALAQRMPSEPVQDEGSAVLAAAEQQRDAALRAAAHSELTIYQLMQRRAAEAAYWARYVGAGKEAEPAKDAAPK